MMTEDKFEELWQRAESQRYVDMLEKEYPAWYRRTRIRQRIAMGVAALVLTVGISLPLFLHRNSDDMERIYCNRGGTTESQWVELASELLLLS